MATRTSPVIPTGTWTVDPGQSSVEFSVRHMGIANVRGKFTEFEGTLEMQPDPEITFESTRVFGNPTMHGITREILQS